MTTMSKLSSLFFTLNNKLVPLIPSISCSQSHLNPNAMLFRALSVTKRHIERQVVHTPAHHLFQIVKNVDAYSQFLPFVTHSQVLTATGNHMKASLAFEFPPFIKDSYVSSVTFDPEQYHVDIVSIESRLFDSLQSKWRMKPLDDNKTHVSLELKVTSSDPLLATSLDFLLPQVGKQQVAAFQQRCRQVPILYPQ